MAKTKARKVARKKKAKGKAASGAKATAKRPTAKKPKPTAIRAPTTAMGARVRIRTDSADVRQGSLGTVTLPLGTARACFVRFDGRATDLLALNSDLEPA